MNRLTTERTLVLAVAASFLLGFALWFAAELTQPGALERLEMIVRGW